MLNKLSSAAGVLTPASVATAPVAVVGLGRWRDTACWLATATNDVLLQHRLRCNNGIRDDRDGMAAHNLSRGSDAGGNMLRELAQAENRDNLKAGPREDGSRRSSLGAKRQLRTEAFLCAVVS